MLHAANALSHGYKRILIIAKDTGIIVQGISFFSDIGADKMWVPFGIGKKLRNISIHDTYSAMSSAKEKALPAYHALFFFIESSIVRLLDRFLPVFGTVDTGEGWYSQVCPRVIGGITTCHKMRHSSMPWQDQITHPCFLARERNKLTQNGARGQSSQPRLSSDG